MRLPPHIIVLFAIVLAALSGAGYALGAEMHSIGVSSDGKGFVDQSTGQAFVPGGFNYDHDEQGRLIEDYWLAEWPKVEADFAEMKALGANVVRVHLQFGKFMTTADRPDECSLAQLARLVRLADKLGLYLDLTGLGCYDRADVPVWYDKLSEEERWTAQAGFWQAIAKQCAASPAIFCYDLMNEPVVPGGRRDDGDWLGPPFADKHFVQFITLDQRDRPRPEIAQAWIKRLTQAIRSADQRHLITVGLVDWSLDRPGLTSGFVPDKIAGPLDFLAVHIYPESGKISEALATLRGFAAAGKPIVIEETFPLRCSITEFKQFVADAKPLAAGWIGFYWGKTPDECRRGGTIADALMLAWLEFFQERDAKSAN